MSWGVTCAHGSACSQSSWQDMTRRWKALYFFTTHSVDNPQTYAAMVFSSRPLQATRWQRSFTRPFLPHHSLITLLLEVLIHIWMLTYVFREKRTLSCLNWKKEKKKEKCIFVCVLSFALMKTVLRCVFFPSPVHPTPSRFLIVRI